MALKTLNSFVLNPNYRYGGSTAAIRLYYSEDFVDSEGRPVFHGVAGASDGFFDQVAVTIAGNIATVAQFSLITTEDSDHPNARVVGVLFDSNNTRRETLFDWAVPANGTIASPTTFAIMEAYNDRNRLITPSTYYLTQAQIQALLNALLANLGVTPATNLVAGIVKLSIAAADPANPIVWGFNDPLVRNAIALQGISISGVPPADGQALVFEADTNLAQWTTLTLNPVVGEIPSGTIDGSNPTFVLANTPVPNSEAVYLNGVRQRRGSGAGTESYTITGATITHNLPPQPGDVLYVDYRF